MTVTGAGSVVMTTGRNRPEVIGTIVMMEGVMMEGVMTGGPDRYDDHDKGIHNKKTGFFSPVFFIAKSQKRIRSLQLIPEIIDADDRFIEHRCHFVPLFLRHGFVIVGNPAKDEQWAGKHC